MTPESTTEIVNLQTWFQPEGSVGYWLNAQTAWSPIDSNSTHYQLQIVGNSGNRTVVDYGWISVNQTVRLSSLWYYVKQQSMNGWINSEYVNTEI